MSSRRSDPGFIQASVILWLSVIFGLLLLSSSVQAQEGIRMSAASEQAAEIQKKASGPGYYNLALGPLGLRFQSELGVEFNDNVNYSAANKQADIALRPVVNMRALWPVSEQNTLFLTTGLGYVKYVKTSSLDHLYIPPDSGIALQIYARDFVFNFHDRFSITENVAQSPSISGTGDFGQIENTPGMAVDWQLNKLILSFGYDHDMISSTSSQFQGLDRTSELFFLRARFVIHETSQAGLEAGGGLTTYDQPIFNDSTHYRIGPFYRAQLSEYVNAKLSAGYVAYLFSSTGTLASAGNVNGFYADLVFNHHANRWLDHSLSLGHQLQLGTSSDLLYLYYARYATIWKIIQDVPLSGRLSFERGSNSGGISETFVRYGIGCGVGYKITQKLGGSIGYDLLIKKSTISAFNYIQNRLVFDFTYSF